MELLSSGRYLPALKALQLEGGWWNRGFNMNQSRPSGYQSPLWLLKNTSKGAVSPRVPFGKYFFKGVFTCSYMKTVHPFISRSVTCNILILLDLRPLLLTKQLGCCYIKPWICVHFFFLGSQGRAEWGWLAVIFTLHHVQGATVVPQGSLWAASLCLQDSLYFKLSGSCKVLHRYKRSLL